MDNLVLRGNTYHFVRRVPRDLQSVLGKKIWKVSLKTSNLREAEAKARRVGVELDAMFKTHRGNPHASLAATASATARRSFKAEMALKRNHTPKHLEEYEAAELADEAASKAWADAREKAVPNADRLSLELIALEQQRADDAITLAAYAGKPLDTTTPYAKLLYASRGKDNASTKKERRRGIEISAATRPIRETVLREDLKPLAQFTRLRDDPNNPRIKTAMGLWFADRQQGESAKKRHTTALNRFVELHGNIPIGEITRRMVESFAKTIEGLTDHRLLPPIKRGGLVTIPDLPKVSAPTVERHIGAIKALSNFAVEKGWIAASPATGVRAPKDTRPKASKRRSFTTEERSILMARAVEEHGENGDMVWLIRLAAYTGCRLEEMAQLGKVNVKRVDGVAVIEIDDLDGRKLKTRDSVRSIPLHPAIASGFMMFSQSPSKGTRVFSFTPDGGGRFANALSGEFGRLMDRANLTDPRLVFHSFRHGLKRAMSNSRVDPDARRAILGHRAKDAHGDYEGHSLAALAAELEKVPILF